MANDRTVAHTLANGIGNWPDATQINDITTKLNDLLYISATAPTSPYAFQIWCKTGVPIQYAFRIYGEDSQWHSIMIGGVVE